MPLCKSKSEKKKKSFLSGKTAISKMWNFLLNKFSEWHEREWHERGQITWMIVIIHTIFSFINYKFKLYIPWDSKNYKTLKSLFKTLKSKPQIS